MAYALQQSRLMVGYVAQAQWAATDNRFDVADRLYTMAAEAGPERRGSAGGPGSREQAKTGKGTQRQMWLQVLAERKVKV